MKTSLPDTTRVTRGKFQARSDGDLLGDLDAVRVQADDLAGVVGQQANGVQAEIGKDLGPQSALMLQLGLAIRSAIGGVVANAGAGLMQVDQNASALLGDP